MKKHILLLIVSSFALLSCNRGDDMSAPNSESEYISFGTFLDADINTKAYSESTEATVKADGFNVAGVIVNGETRTLLFNEKAVWSSSTYVTESKLYSWPASGSMDFYAVHPVSQSVTMTEGAASLSYSHNGDTDLIGASATGQTSSAVSGVQLTFDHLLTLVRFTAEGTDTDVKYKVKTIKITVPNGGTYTYASGSWAAASGTVQETYSSTETALSGVTAIAGGLTAVPCTPSVYVEWNTYQADGTTLIAEYNGTKTLGEAMQQGKECTINLKLPNSDASDITFSVSVNSWDSQNATITFD